MMRALTFSIFMPLAQFSTALKTSDSTLFADMMKDIQTDPQGHVHLADDGVIRSYADDGTTVLDYVALTGSQIQSLIRQKKGEERAHYNDVFADVDGTRATNMTEI